MRFFKILQAFTFAALAGANSAVAQPREIQREIQIVGASDGADLLRMLAEEFPKHHPKVRIDVSAPVSAGIGLATVGAGKAPLGRIGRALSEDEKSSGIVYRPLARIPSAFLISKAAGISALTSLQIAEIFAGHVSNWRELGGRDLRIRIVRRDSADTTLASLRAGMPGWRDLAITEKSKLATTAQEVVETVRSVAGAIGFGPYSRQLPAGIVVLKVDGRAPDDPAYPASVELALVHRHDMDDAEAKAFTDFATSEKARAHIRTFGARPAGAGAQ